MKSKVIISVLLIVVSVFAGNWILGNISSRKIEERLSSLPNNAKVEYDNLKVNPLWSKITFKDFVYVDPSSGYQIKSETLEVKMKHSEALVIAKTGKIESLSKLYMDFDKFNFSTEDNLNIEGEAMDIEYDGFLTPEDIKNLDNKFPENKQKLNLYIEDAKVLTLPLERNQLNGVVNKIKDIENAEFQMSFNPDKNIIVFEKVNVNSKGFEITADAKIDYHGEGLEGFTSEKVDLRYDTELKDGIDCGEEGSSKFSLKKFNSSFDGILLYDEDGELKGAPTEAKFSLNLKDLGIQAEGSNKQLVENQLAMLGLRAEDLFISDFSINGNIEDGRCVIDDTHLILSVLEASLKANVILNEENIEGSDIEELQMRISNINPKLNETLTNLTKTFGLKIPRDGDDILLEVKGSIAKPQIKGIHF